jgi:hypothetical protein
MHTLKKLRKAQSKIILNGNKLQIKKFKKIMNSEVVIWEAKLSEEEIDNQDKAIRKEIYFDLERKMKNIWSFKQKKLLSILISNHELKH